MPSPIRIVHLIVRLDTGGAEKSLYRLVRHAEKSFVHEVLCLGPESAISAAIARQGVAVHCFDYPRRGPLALWQAWRVLRQNQPDILQGWMYLGNLLASILALTLSGTALAWNVRNAPEQLKAERLRTRLAMQLARAGLLRPDYVIYNSEAAVAAHDALGYNKYSHGVISNGIDVDEYQYDADLRNRMRENHGVADQVWVGMIGRFHPLKGVDDFLRAGAELKREHGALRLLLAGPGMSADNPALQAAITAAELDAADVDLLGPQDDVLPLLCGLDLLVLASHREGTPNILLEAMAASLLTVATRVGDVTRILGDEERLVVPGDIDDLKRKMAAALAAEAAQGSARREAERQFVAERFSVSACMAAYAEVYATLAGKAAKQAGST